jgi:hypothetical protein
MTMSNLCRCFPTTFGPGVAKLLIRHAAGAVAEGRQGWEHQYGRTMFRATVASAIRASASLAECRVDREAQDACDTRCRFRARADVMNCLEILARHAFDNAYCRSFSTLHRASCLFYTRPEPACGQV